MNAHEAKIVLGLLTGVALLALLVRSVWINDPLTDRTLAIFAGLLWAYLNVDIGLKISDVVQADTDTDQRQSRESGSDNE